MNSAGQTKLQLRLENDEPKCANCSNWDRDPKLPTFGACQLMVRLVPPEGAELASLAAATTDLSVCSKWEPKD